MYHAHPLKVFVGGLPYNADEDDLRSLIERTFGKVQYCVIIREQRRGVQYSRGFGFVTFEQHSDYQSAINRATAEMEYDMCDDNGVNERIKVLVEIKPAKPPRHKLSPEWKEGLLKNTTQGASVSIPQHLPLLHVYPRATALTPMEFGAARNDRRSAYPVQTFDLNRDDDSCLTTSEPQDIDDA